METQPPQLWENGGHGQGMLVASRRANGKEMDFHPRTSKKEFSSGSTLILAPQRPTSDF